jgi:[acyl-carrier-protein] S-malonyltransferase
VAPAGGTFHPVAIDEGMHVAARSPLGTVRTRREEHQLIASYQGVLAEWLLEDGDLVGPGEPVARLYPVRAGVA